MMNGMLGCGSAICFLFNQTNQTNCWLAVPALAAQAAAPIKIS